MDTSHRCLGAMLQVEKGLARLVGGDSGKLAPVSEFALDAAAAMSRSPSKTTSLGRWLTVSMQDTHLHCAIPASATPGATCWSHLRLFDCMRLRNCTAAKGVLLVVCSAGGSSAALSPLAASEAGASGLIRAVHSLKDVTALHGSIEVGLHVTLLPIGFLGERRASPP
jgi:hypothetical protein